MNKILEKLVKDFENEYLPTGKKVGEFFYVTVEAEYFFGKIRSAAEELIKSERNRFRKIVEEEKIGCDNHAQMPPCMNPVHAFNHALSAVLKEIEE